MAKSQTEDVLNHIKNNGSISSKEAFEKYGATRLSAIIFRLRRRGYDIQTTMETTITRYGKTVEYARYIMGKEKE